MTAIELLWADLLIFLHHLFSPEVLGTVVTVGGIAWKFVTSMTKKMAVNSKKLTDDIRKDLKEFKQQSLDNDREMKKEIIRLQLLQGMDAHRLSASEAAYFYDKYHDYGGNSFVTEKYHEYLKQLEDEENAESDS